jgi:hypothetical protein
LAAAEAHNVAVTDAQNMQPCPHCHSPMAVHSMSALAAMARNQPPQANIGRLAGLQSGYGAPSQSQPRSGAPDQTQAGYGAPSQTQAGYGAPSQNQAGPAAPGQAQPGWTGEPQPSWSAEPQPGWAAEPEAGHGSGQQRSGRSGQGPVFNPDILGDALGDGIENAVASAALGAAARFLGGRVARRAQQAFTEKVVPALAQRQEAVFREQDAIAERYPDLHACLNDKVFFVAGGNRVLPMPSGRMLTLQESDSLVTQLRHP